MLNLIHMNVDRAAPAKFKYWAKIQVLFITGI